MSTAPEVVELTVTNTGEGDDLEVSASTAFPGLSVEPASLVVADGAADVVTVTWVGAGGATFGEQSGAIYLVSNAATSGYLAVPFFANVLSGDVSASPDSVELEMVDGVGTGTLDIVVGSGEGASVTDLTFDDARFAAWADLPATLWASTPLTVAVTFSSDGVPGTVSSVLTATTTSGSAEVATVSVTVE